MLFVNTELSIVILVFTKYKAPPVFKFASPSELKLEFVIFRTTEEVNRKWLVQYTPFSILIKVIEDEIKQRGAF